MAIETDDIFTQVITFAIGTGDEFQNKFTWKYTGSGYSEAGLIGGMDTWAENFYELMDDQMVSTTSAFVSEYDKIAWDDVDDVWETVANIGMGSGAVTLLNATDLLPFQCAPCLVGFTAKPKSRGRKSIPLFCEDQQAASTWVAAAETALIAALAEYLTSHTIVTNHDVVPGVASTTWGIFLPFVSGLVKDIVFTQRRRTLGRGS